MESMGKGIKYQIDANGTMTIIIDTNVEFGNTQVVNQPVYYTHQTLPTKA